MNTPEVVDNLEEQQQRSWVETQLVPRIEAAGCLQGAVSAPYVSASWNPLVEFELKVAMESRGLIIRGTNKIKAVLTGAEDDTESFEVIISPDGHVSYGTYNTGETNMLDERIYAVLLAANGS